MSMPAVGKQFIRSYKLLQCLGVPSHHYEVGYTMTYTLSKQSYGFYEKYLGIFISYATLVCLFTNFISS